jgi:peptidoglycan/LPS O-acetylase OafA/YrhL
MVTPEIVREEMTTRQIIEKPVPGKITDPVMKGSFARKYRADIDGLRAIAVLSVVAFHIDIKKTPGGYVGVDVFFVISGYLISSIIFSEIAASRFSMIAFYERRIRRIFPALFGLLAICSMFAVLYLLPTELVNYAKSMFAATSFLSNFYFLRHSGYFDLPTSQPLLHTWSLAIEEQFYIVFPLLLALIRKLFPRRLRVSVIVLFFMSLFASALVVSHSKETAFYMPYTRAWELLLGTILSLEILPPLQSFWLRNFASFLGIGMIMVSVLFYTQDTLFPGLSALMPCVGSALIIWAGESGSSLVGGVLSWRPLVFIGLISYSLYLWHWPVIILRRMGVLIGVGAFASHHFAGAISSHRFDMLIEIAISFALAILSWRFVERPFRYGPLRLSGRRLFALAGAVMLILFAISSWTVFAGGFATRFPNHALQVLSNVHVGEELQSMRAGVCFVNSGDRFEQYRPDVCLRQDGSKKNYLLLGDSHSAVLWSALSSSLPEDNIMQASVAGCQPALYPSGPSDCRKMMTYIFQVYLPSHPIQELLLVGEWTQKDMQPLSAVIYWAKQHHLPVTVFGPSPEYDSPLPRLLVYSIVWKEPSLPSQHLVPTIGDLDVEMQNSSSNTWRVPYISLYKTLCPTQRCVEYADTSRKVPIMGDAHHFTQMGAFYVVRHLIEAGELN